ncbi:hypothetical protein AX16_002568 [Volvariella volvacea WC 439]|nr:hypothetical protein AX16_002568 [Volvariella volvacea WC 439]
MPSPKAPYYLQIYTSTFVFPFVIDAGEGLTFDWAVPFAPGTQYQICMFDSEGRTGGCQASYTVIEPASRSSCPNVTFPQGPLDVNAVVRDGPLSQFGWIDQCTDISVTPRNGTPPYTFTIAPSLHPPTNITANDMKTMNWTVELSWASQFFISVSDSMGNSWSQGPLHSGGNGPTACLAMGAAATDSNTISPGIAIGGSLGGLLVGLLAGIGAAYVFMSRRQDKKDKSQLMELQLGSQPVTFGVVSSGHSAVSSRPLRPNRSEYHIEPFTLPTDQGNRSNSVVAAPPQDPTIQRATSFAASSIYPQSAVTSVPGSESQPLQIPPPASPGGASPVNTVAPTIPPPSRPQQSQVYVIHHDGGRAPVTVYHSDGTEVVELPPRYADGGSGTRPLPPVGGISTDTRGTSVSAPGTAAGSGSGGGTSDRLSEAGRTDYSMTDGGRSNTGGTGASALFLQQERRPGPIRKGGTASSSGSGQGSWSPGGQGYPPRQGQGQGQGSGGYNPSDPGSDWGAQ